MSEGLQCVAKVSWSKEELSLQSEPKVYLGSLGIKSGRLGFRRNPKCAPRRGQKDKVCKNRTHGAYVKLI